MAARRTATRKEARATSGRRDRNKTDKRERLRSAAWELWCERGFDAVTTREVAARARVATGTLFLYASDKLDLLCMVFHDRLERACDEGFRSLPAGLALEAELLHLFRRLFALYGEQPELARVFLQHLAAYGGPNGQRLQGLTFAFVYRLAQLVTHAQERGEVARDVDALQAATNVFSLYYGTLTSWLTGLTTLEHALDPGLVRALQLQFRGLAARPA